MTLAQLQNLAKQDPAAYEDEFMQQYRRFQAQLEIFTLKPTDKSRDFGDLVSFLAALSPSYPAVLAEFPEQIKELLKSHSRSLDAELRQTMCRALILLRNRSMLTSTALLELFFELFGCPDKLLRELLFKHIVADIQRLNAKHRNNAVNKTLQNFMYKMLGDDSQVAAKKSLDVMVTLFHKQVWNDGKTANVIASACFSPHVKIVVAATKFFLGMDQEALVADDDEDGAAGATDDPYLQLLKNEVVTKKTRKRKQKLAKALRDLHRKEQKKSRKELHDFSALHLINDPQSFAEKLFKRLKSSKDRFEVKLMTMNLIGRLVGVHQLTLLGFYSFLQRYLVPHQTDVTHILTYVAQASHEFVPGDAISPLIHAIANNFVTDRSSVEAISVGLNSIREICARCPLAMDETLLEDLVQYRKYRKGKSVVMAARSLVHLFREVNPLLLPKSERGRPGDAHDSEQRLLEFGATEAADFVPGTELLSMYEEVRPEDADGEEDLDGLGWESASDDDDIEGDWVTVKHDGMPDVRQEVEEDDIIRDELDAEERKKRAVALSATRVLSDEDFARIRQLQLQAKLRPSGKRPAMTNLETDEDEILDPTKILPARKKQRQDKEERLASILEGRRDRGKFGIRKGKLNPMASTTNKEKAKLKNPMMLKHTSRFRAKTKASLRDKQIAKRKSVLKDKRRRK